MAQTICIPGAPDLAADLYLPSEPSNGASFPAVVTGSGFGGVKEMLLPHFADALARAGIATLAVDYGGFGGSAGEPRQDLVPRSQIRDLRRGLDWLGSDRRIDPARLGIFGPSMCGAHTLVLAGKDPRVRAAVSMVPFVRAPKAPPSARVGFALAVDTFRRALRLPSRLIPAAGRPGSFAVMTTDGAVDWLNQVSADAPTFRNEVTVRSLARLAAYRPVRSLRPNGVRAPLLVILSRSDSVTPAALVRDELRGVPHEAIEFDGSHFELFGEHLERVTRLTIDWFVRHLAFDRDARRTAGPDLISDVGPPLR